MEESMIFYGFRGFITFPDQSSIFNINISNDADGKNKMFRHFFDFVQERQMINSLYQSRAYILIFKNKYDDLIHCQLARKKKFNKRELVENVIVECEDNDYPYVNIFIDLKSQKFLVESKTLVFENYETCGKVLENIINNNLAGKDVKITLSQIMEEEKFWNYFNNDSKVYSIELNFVSPNIFGAEDAADALLKDAQENVGSEKVSLKFSNSEENLKPNKKGFASFIRYISAGGGNWKITVLSDNGRKEKIKSTTKSTKVKVPLSIEKLNKQRLDEKDILYLINGFNSIEIFEKLKEKNE